MLVYETVPRPDTRPFDSETPVIYLHGERGRPLALLRWIIRHRADFDVLHVHTHVDRKFLSYAVARLLGWKVIYSSTLADSVDELVDTYRPKFRPLVRRLFSLFHIFVGISPRLYSGHRVGPERARLIPQGVQLAPLSEPDEREATRQSLSIGPDEVVLLYLGSLCLRKGVHFLVESFVRLASVRPELRLVLVGPVLEPDYGERIFSAIQDSGLAARVNHIDFAPSPARFYAAADIFVFASTDEGFGNVLLEAMSHGLPVVSRYLDGVTEAFLEHGVNGFLFAQAEHFESCVLALTADPELRRNIGGTAREFVRRKFGIQDIAGRYVDLYRELTGTGPQRRGDVAMLSPAGRRQNFPPLQAIDQAGLPPMLLVVIDTESEFEWAKGVAADTGAVRSIERLPAVQEMFQRFGVTPCYVLDYPVATQKDSAATMRRLAAQGAEIGAHLQPWTTPPFVEPVDNGHAFPGNLPVWLQQKKLAVLCEAIEKAVGKKPVIFKAGRYGVGPATMGLLEEMGFQVDLSFAPGFNYAAEGGPDFSGYGPGLSWFGESRDLLEIPTTSGFTGPLGKHGTRLWHALEIPILRQVHLRGILDRSGLLSRIRLSPEGYNLRQMKKLTQRLLRADYPCLTLSFHSSSLQPGFTPYCSNEEEVRHLLARLEAFLRFFRDELGGRFTSPLALHRDLQARKYGHEP